jgi:phosphatidylserine/phosphatidylglycerophosphate/cardiolipin synthase-like enzyme
LLPPAISAVFSPEDWQDIISLMDSAQESMDIEIYVLSSRDVVEALERAKARGVGIRIIIERNTIGTGNEDIYRELASKGFNIRYASPEFKLTHSKFMIIDGKAVLVGSHNLSNSALKYNREASVIIRDMAAVEDFIGVFESDWALGY